jgi:FG-GAP repeat
MPTSGWREAPVDRIVRAALLIATSTLLLGGTAQAWLAPPTAPAASTAGRPVVGPDASPDGSTVGAKADFNGDGFGDLAIGVPGENVGSASNAGGVNVIYGATGGLHETGNQFWSQNSSGVIGDAETNDHFGASVAAGDFNGDGFTDIAVGVPFESVGAVQDAGGVNVLYGTSGGLSSTNNQLWSQSSSGLKGGAAAGDELGFAIVARDLNDDGLADLAVGVPHRSSKDGADAGAVDVLFGSASGLSAAGSDYFHGANAGDEFGAALAAGNFDGKKARDLAVGAPDAADQGATGAGRVYWLSSNDTGLHGPQVTSDLVPEPGAHCGASLAAGNFDNDPKDVADLAAGCPNGHYPLSDDGSVEIHIGGGAGLGGASQSITLPSDQAGAEFGSAVAAADFGGDGTGGSDDLAVGAPLFNVQGKSDSGEIEVLYFGSNPAHQTFSQATQGIIGDPESGDLFGAALTTGNFDNDGFADVAVGVLGESVGSVPGAGGVNVLYGSGNGIAAAGNQFWSQASNGIFGTAEAEDFFGSALSGRAG